VDRHPAAGLRISDAISEAGDFAVGIESNTDFSLDRRRRARNCCAGAEGEAEWEDDRAH
jgi:hypothetical protein